MVSTLSAVDKVADSPMHVPIARAPRNSRKIMLIFPGKRVGGGYRPSMPLPLIAIAAPLMDAGYEVEIYDQRVQPSSELFSKNLGEYLFVGLSSLTGNPIVYGLELCEEIRRRVPDLPLVWGGVHPSLMPDQTLKTSEYVDIIVRGEGEVTVVELSNALFAGTPFTNILGLSYKEGDRIIHNLDRPYIDFDSVKNPLPYHLVDRNLVDFDEDFLYQSARGCPFDCKFCDVIAFHTRDTRQKSVEKVVAELVEIDRRYKPGMIEFVDDLFFINLDRCGKIMQGIVDNKLGFKWRASCRANIAMKFTPEYVDLMAKSGCRNIYVGAESGSPRMLEYMSKRISPEQIEMTVEKLSRVGILTTMNFMTGFPTENMDDVKKTVDLVARLEARFPRKDYIMGGINTFAPYPGSELHREVIKLGFKPPETFREWGVFILNERRQMNWLPKEHVEFIQRVALVSRWKGPGPEIKHLFDVLFKPRGFNAFVKKFFNGLFAIRWRNKNFSAPVDIYIWAWLTKKLMKQG